MPDTHPEISPALARFMAETPYDEIPEPVIERVKKSILDVIGVGVYGSDFPAVQAPLTYAQQHCKGDDATIVLGGGRATAFGAAMVNGTYVHTTELAEGFTRALVHPGNCIIPAVLAAGERDHRSGRDLLAGSALGYELNIRMGLSCGLHLSVDLGLHPPAVLGIFASAGAVARMHGLDADGTGHALGIASSQCTTSQLRAADQHATIKDLFQGHTAAAGLVCADLAVAGMTGLTDWVTPWYHSIPRKYDLDPLLDGLGERWHTSSGGIRVKTRPVMGMAQPATQAMYQMLGAHDIDPDDVVSIRVESSERIWLGNIHHPTDLTSARAGIPFLVAAALARPKTFTSDRYMIHFLEDDMLADPLIAALSDKVELVTNPEFDHNLERAEPSRDGSPYMKFEARVTVRLADGSELSEYADMFSLGTGNMSRGDMVDKFRAVTEGKLDTERAQAVIDTVWSLDDLDDVGDLVALLAEA